MNLGGAALVKLVTGNNALDSIKFDTDFKFDPAQSSDWKNLWSDFSFILEFDELLDFTAVAIASFIPEVRFWLEGNRWAYFGSSRFGIRSAGGFRYNGDVMIDETARQMSLHSGNSGNPSGTGRSESGTRTEARSRSLSEFVSGMFFKLIKLPITYVILTIGLAVLVINLNRQSRA